MTEVVNEARSVPTVAILLLAGFQGGGAERVAAALASDPPHRGPTLIITNTPPSADRYATSLEVPRIILGVDLDEANYASTGLAMRIVGLARLLRRTRRALRRHHVDVVISFLTTANLLAILASFGSRRRTIVSERNDPTREVPKPSAIRLGRRLLYRFAASVTANTDVAVDAMRPYVPARKLACIPNAVEIPATHGDPGASRSIVTIGRLTDHKDQSTIVDALALISNSEPDWTLDVIGDGPKRSSLLAHIAARKLDGRVRLRGFVEDPTPHLACAGVFVLASRYEGLPNALLEAMANGLPCVVADTIVGARSLVEHDVTGLVFRCGDAHDLADQLTRLLGDPELRREFGHRARQRVRHLEPAGVRELWAGLINEAARTGRR